MSHEIKIKAVLDEQAFEKEADQMSRTMDKMYERSYSSANNIRQQQVLNQNLGSIGLPQSGSAAGNNFNSATNAGDRKFREEAIAQMRVIDQRRDQIQKHAESISKLETEQKKYNRASQEALNIEKQITKQKENQMRMEGDLLQRQTNLNKAFKERAQNEQGTGGKVLEGFSKGGLQGAMKTGVEAIGGGEALLAMGVAGAAVYAIRQITNVADSIVREIASVNRVTQTATGNAVSGSTGNYLSQVYGGRSVFETGNARERAGAFKDASTEEGRLRGLESFKAGDAGAFGFSQTGRDSNAGGMLYGGMNALFGDETQRARFLGRFSGSQMEKYNALSTERMVRNYGENFESAKNKDPMKQLALQNYEQTHNRDLGMQRQLGLNDNMMYGSSGFMRSYQDQGYTNEQGMGAMNNILSAGGSTRMGREPGTALQASKNFDLTNADSVLGKLSGNFGDANKSKSAMIEILSEGTRVGLNKSEFREEQRKFTEAAANFLSKGYSGTDSDMERLSQIFGNGLNAKTGTGINAASNAADTLSNVSSQGVGPEGSLGFASLMSNKIGKRLSYQSQQSLNTMDLKDVTLNNPRIASYASEASTGQNPVSPQDIVDLKMQTVKDKLFRNKDMQRLTEDVTRDKDIQFPGMSNAQIAEAARNGDPEAKKIIDRLGTAQSYVATAYGVSNDQNRLDALTDTLGRFGTKGYQMTDDTRSMIEKQLGNQGTGRTGDNANAAIAKDQAMVTDKTAAMLGDFNAMADASKKMSVEMVNAMLRVQEIATQLKGLSGNEYSAKLHDIAAKIGNVFDAAGAKPGAAANQPQSGKR